MNILKLACTEQHPHHERTETLTSSTFNWNIQL